MSVGAAHPEGTNSRDSLLRVGPRSRTGKNFDRDFVPRNMRIGRFKIHLAGNLIVLHRQQDFDQPRHAGGRFQVADVGLHRSDQQRIVAVSFSRERRRGGLHLDRITKLRPCAMYLEIRNFVCRNTGSRERRADDFFLSLRVGRCQAAAKSVVSHSRAANDAQHAVPVSASVFQTL